MGISNIAEIDYNSRFLARHDLRIDCELAVNLFTESRVNTYLLHNGTDKDNQHYYDNNEFRDDVSFLLEKVSFNETEGLVLRDDIARIADGYNKDYSYVQNIIKYRHLAQTYDYCSDCLGEFHTRIIYSDVSFSETQQDNYLQFRVNNYIDLPSNKGSITAIDYKDGQLWIRTQYSCFLITPNPQQLQVSDTTVNIGTGDFLSLSERELNTVDLGFGGQLDPNESIMTEHGLIWADRYRKKIFRVGAKLEEISRNGMFNFFFEQMDNDIPLRFGYDPVKEYLYVTQKGNWTLTYEFASGLWKSFVKLDYPIEYYINSNEILYTQSNVDKYLYSHNGIPLPATFEVLYSSNQPFHLQSVMYYAQGDNMEQVLVYNSKQQSGYQELRPTNRIQADYDLLRKYLYNDNFISKITGLRDLNVSDQQLVDIYSDNAVQDIDANLPQYQLQKFYDRWIGIRLLITKGKRTVLNYIQTLKVFTEIENEQLNR